MAKPKLTQPMIESIIGAFAAADRVPQPDLVKALSELSGMLETSINSRYVVLYQEAQGTDDDPTAMPAPLRG